MAWLKEKLAVADGFDTLADNILNNIDLCVNTGDTPAKFRICELEVYYFNENHKDYYTHRDLDQRAFGNWYFHKKGGTYKNGTFKGLDITFGDGPTSTYGGILIRAIEAIESESPSYIEGPCNVVNHLLKLTDKPTIAELVGAMNNISATDNNILYLRPGAAREARVFKCPRVGLRLRTKPTRASYLMAHYRFLTDPRKVKKGVPYLICGLHGAGLNIDEIDHWVRSRRSTIETYMRHIAQGVTKEKIEVKLFARNICEAYGYVAGSQ